MSVCLAGIGEDVVGLCNFCHCCTIVLADSGAVPDLARLMIRDCRYDVSLPYFKQSFFIVECMIKEVIVSLGEEMYGV